MPGDGESSNIKLPESQRPCFPFRFVYHCQGITSSHLFAGTGHIPVGGCHSYSIFAIRVHRGWYAFIQLFMSKCWYELGE